ncbi:head maturation protease, ClpP-related [Chitinophaga sp. Hz27]|uniref:head maturation protease, ClpP-related n=1 Tax=Chitinophaga sp. Hz27 TaxID=3347169 RepID=UPI0035D71D50
MKFHILNHYSAKNNANSLDIHIDGEIVDAQTQQIFEKWFGDETSVSFRSFRNQIESSGASIINVYINSPGGMVTDAMAMHDYLKDLQSKGKTVNTYGRGIIASASTYVLMASNKPEMSKNSWFMIHNVSGFAYGDVNQMEQQTAIIRQFNDQVRDFYADATGIRKEDITKMMNAETWLTAEEAKDKGFISSISGDAVFNKAIPQNLWPYNNMAPLTAYNNAVKEPPIPQPSVQEFILNQFSDMKNFFTNLFNTARKDVTPAENATPGEIATQILNALEEPFKGIETEVQTMVNTAIANQRQEIETSITNTLTEKITNLESANTALQNEIAQLKGNKSTNKNADPAPRIVGSFSSND